MAESSARGSATSTPWRCRSRLDLADSAMPFSKSLASPLSSCRTAAPTSRASCRRVAPWIARFASRLVGLAAAPTGPCCGSPRRHRELRGGELHGAAVVVQADHALFDECSANLLQLLLLRASLGGATTHDESEGHKEGPDPQAGSIMAILFKCLARTTSDRPRRVASSALDGGSAPHNMLAIAQRGGMVAPVWFVRDRAPE